MGRHRRDQWHQGGLSWPCPLTGCYEARPLCILVSSRCARSHDRHEIRHHRGVRPCPYQGVALSPTGVADHDHSGIHHHRAWSPWGTGMQGILPMVHSGVGARQDGNRFAWGLPVSGRSYHPRPWSPAACRIDITGACPIRWTVTIRRIKPTSELQRHCAALLCRLFPSCLVCEVFIAFGDMKRKGGLESGFIARAFQTVQIRPTYRHAYFEAVSVKRCRAVQLSRLTPFDVEHYLERKCCPFRSVLHFPLAFFPICYTF